MCARDEAAILRVAAYRSPNVRSALGRAAGKSTWSRFWAVMSSMLGVAWTAPAVSTLGEDREVLDRRPSELLGISVKQFA